MKVAQINMTPVGSTGKIMRQITITARETGIEAHSFTAEIFSVHERAPRLDEENLHYFGSFFENMLHSYLGKLLGLNGYFSYFGTLGLIRKLKKISPDIVHLHNLHNFCINLPLLFRYLKKSGINVIWTLHDCWAFTGHCPHFDMFGCDRWKTGCFKCGQLRGYPKSYLDTSKMIYNAKKKMFTSLKNLTLVTPSEWLAELVRESFLKNFPVKVINNGIDLSVFKPTESDFREKHGLENKKLVLAVSFGWGARKGLDVLLELAARLPKNYALVLVGTNDALDKALPDNVLSIHRTNNQAELAEIYSAADVFVNATREETLGLVNIEALACGTPVITFRTGGSPECIDPSCGSVVEKNDIDAMEKEIIRICEETPYSKEACLRRAEHFKIQERFDEYIGLYLELIK